MAKLGIEVPVREVMASLGTQLIWQSEHPLEIQLEQRKKSRKRAAKAKLDETEGEKASKQLALAISGGNK